MRLTASDYHVLFRRRARKGIVALSFASLSWAQAGTAAASPPPADEASVARGAQTFQQYCTECHGRDGRAQVDVISDATDLTDPDAYYSGASEQDIFNSIAFGAGVAMPPFETELKGEEEIWHLVNFIRSLWTDEQREAF